MPSTSTTSGKAAGTTTLRNHPKTETSAGWGRSRWRTSHSVSSNLRTENRKYGKPVRRTSFAGRNSGETGVYFFQEERTTSRLGPCGWREEDGRGGRDPQNSVRRLRGGDEAGAGTVGRSSKVREVSWGGEEEQRSWRQRRDSVDRLELDGRGRPRDEEEEAQTFRELPEAEIEIVMVKNFAICARPDPGIYSTYRVVEKPYFR